MALKPERITIVSQVPAGTPGTTHPAPEPYQIVGNIPGASIASGQVVLVAGTATVATTAITSSNNVVLSTQALGTVATAQPLAVTARTAGVSFTITSAGATDTSTVYWSIFA